MTAFEWLMVYLVIGFFYAADRITDMVLTRKVFFWLPVFLLTWPWWFLVRLFFKKRTTVVASLPKLVIVADTEDNRLSSYWRAMIGRKGTLIDHYGEFVSVHLDDEIVPHVDVLAKRFVFDLTPRR